MEAGRLNAIDWAAPWFAPWRSVGEPVARDWQHKALYEALNGGHECPPYVRFVGKEELAEGDAYESHIFRTGTCPTRENLHDFFNGLCWLQFPQSKRALNRLQAEAIAASGIGGARGPVRDAITVLDENGALLQAPAPLWDALLARQWRRLFVDLRPLWNDARFVIFGHALLEKLVEPRKDLTAHVWHCDIASDADLVARLTPEKLAAKPFTPLPVLGIPGWSAENQNFCFYDDSVVFRPARRDPKP